LSWWNSEHLSRARGSQRRPSALANRNVDHIAVMLHLLGLYDSKAAILTMSIRSYRSKIEVPLEFQGLGSLGAASVATVFPLRV
jgi:endonuclease III